MPQHEAKLLLFDPHTLTRPQRWGYFIYGEGFQN